MSGNKMIRKIESVSMRLVTAFILSFVFLTGTINIVRSDELNVRLGEDFTTLDPAFWQSGADFTMINVLFPKLIEFKSGSDWEYELQAAESIEQVLRSGSAGQLGPHSRICASRKQSIA